MAEIAKRLGIVEGTIYRYFPTKRELIIHVAEDWYQGMLADYDRELALVALDPASGEFVGVGRFAPNADGETAEFALTIADAWQGRGVGRALLERVCDCARDAGYKTLFGHILNANRDMLGLAERLNFVETGREADLVTVARALR